MVFNIVYLILYAKDLEVVLCLICAEDLQLVLIMW